MKVTNEIITKFKNIPTPFLLIDLDILKANYHNLESLLPDVEIFYAMKANDHVKVCKTLFDEGAPFEVSSLNETKKLINLGVKPKSIMCLNPIKSPEFLEWMNDKNIEVMAFDAYDELDKIKKYTPHAKVVVRVLVPDEGSLFPLNNRYGVDPIEAVKMMIYAQKIGLKPYGITFHVGSQCPDGKNWITALEICKDIYDKLKKESIQLSIISLGGGLPIEYLTPISPLPEIANDILSAINIFKGENIRFTIEPGRGIVATAGNMITSVVGKAKRLGEEWIYLDVGVYNGLMEITGGFRFNITTEKDGDKVSTTIAGPSCDSLDVIAEHINFPKVAIGDRVTILDVGCYSTVFASEFNGFEIPRTYFVNE